METDSQYVSFDKYIQSITDAERLKDLEKIKEIENLEEDDKQSFEHIYLISRTLKRPIEIFINDNLHYTIGLDFQGISKAIQVEKLIQFGRPKWKKLTGI